MDKKWWTLLAVCLATFMLLLDITIVVVALPSIQQDLKATFSDLQWVVDAYALTLAALMLTAGSLADLYGRRLVFRVGVVIFTLGSLLCGLSNSPLFLVLARAGQGIGGAAMFSTALALIAHAFRGPERGVAFAVWGAVVGLAVAIGPVLGGVITSEIDWRWIFFVNIPIGVLAVVMATLKVEESRQPTAKRPDWPGFVAFTALLALLIYGLIRASETSWTQAGVLASFAVAVVALITFVAIERSSQHPMFDLSLFKVPTFVGGLTGAFGISASIFSLLLYLVLYLQYVLGYSALQTGLRLLIISAGILVTSAVAGRLTSKVPIKFLVTPGLLIIAGGLALMAGLNAGSQWTHLIPGFIIAGLGCGMVNPALASTAVGVVEPHRAGMASGINNTLRQVGIATGIAALGSIFAVKERADLAPKLASIPHLGISTSTVVTDVRNGDVQSLLAKASPADRAALVHLVRASFTDGLNEILLIGTALAAVAGIASFFLIRTKDLAAGSQADVGAGQPLPDAPKAGVAAAEQPAVAYGDGFLTS